MKGAGEIFRFLLDAAARGERAALATITDIDGPSPRSVGTHMAIAEGGTSLGSFSGGCTEAAVVGEAQRALAKGCGGIVRFGTGSPLIDIRLPCGGAVDFLLSPDPSVKVVRAAFDRLATRRPVALELDRNGTIHLAAPTGTPTGWRDDRFLVRHEPNLQIIVFGDGAEAYALARLAAAYGADVLVIADVAEVARRAAPILKTLPLAGFPAPRGVEVDGATAIVFLLHEHERETDLLIWALEQPSFFIGAMGSMSTHRTRLQALKDRGVTDADCDRVIGPVGLIAAARDPDTLALSILSQIVAEELKNPR